MRRAVFYLRVSTIDQTTANQERELRDIAARMGCEVVKVYKDHGISGAKGEMGGLRSMHCAEMPLGGNSMSLWLGRWIASAAVCKTWSASYLKSTPWGLIYSCINRASTPRHRLARRCFR